MPEPVRIFVSYASADRAFAERLVGDLQSAGAEVWWDVSGIDQGDFLGKINAALQQCQWLVLVLTPNAVASKWVNIEVNAAIHRRESGLMRGVLPVLASPTAQDAIPPVWANLHRYNAVNDYPSEVARLTRTLDLSHRPAESPQTQSAIPDAPPPNRLPPRLASLGYKIVFRSGAEVILPPVCYVHTSSFPMGSDPNIDKDAQRNEQPQHRLRLNGFMIGQFPVTVAEFACFLEATRKLVPKGEDGKPYEVSWQRQLRERLDHPVVMVSFQDAMGYAKWLSDCTGQVWRLPSEAEWERAARADLPWSSIYPWGATFDMARCNTRGGSKTLAA
jgi:hypothetical protein